LSGPGGRQPAKKAKPGLKKLEIRAENKLQ